jgi:hypothetical protein
MYIGLCVGADSTIVIVVTFIIDIRLLCMYGCWDLVCFLWFLSPLECPLEVPNLQGWVVPTPSADTNARSELLPSPVLAPWSSESGWAQCSGSGAVFKIPGTTLLSPAQTRRGF